MSVGHPLGTMQGDPQVIQHLQAQLNNELTATNQYFLHYRILKHWGFGKLAKKEYEESIGEMKHADRLMERILVEGLPNLQELGKLVVGENVPEILESDLRLERAASHRQVLMVSHKDAGRALLRRTVVRPSLSGGAPASP
jgi:bacterioferritin